MNKYSDTELLDFLENNKQYILGFAPSKDWSAFCFKPRVTCYGKNVRECLEQLIIMHKDINDKKSWNLVEMTNNSTRI